MTGASQTWPEGGAESRLPRFCLPTPRREPERALAWVNSICLLFLLIGMFGAKPASISLKRLPPIEQLNAVMVEPLPPPPQAPDESQKQQPLDQEKTQAPQVVVVTPESPSINFSVPTIGNLVVPNALATPPPLTPLKTVEPLRLLPDLLNNTGAGGERPRPPYPTIAREEGQQGSVLLLMTVNDAGQITDIEVKDSSGFPILDRSTLEYVKRHWIVPPGKGARRYAAKINYRLRAEE